MSKYNNKTLPQKIALVGIDTLFVVFFILFLDIEFLQNGIMNVGSMDRTFNLVPFRSIKAIFQDLGKVEAFKQILTTAALFATMGVFASIFSGKRMVQPIILILFFTLSIEIFQYLAACGVADIDDFLINTFGGIVGIFVDKILLKPIDKAIGVRIITFVLLLLLGSFTVYSNYQLSDFSVDATTELYNDYLIEEASKGNSIIKGKVKDLTNENMKVNIDGETEIYDISDDTKMIIQRVQREYTTKGLLKNTIIVYEEVDRREFVSEMKNHGDYVTLYVNGFKKIVAMEVIVD